MTSPTSYGWVRHGLIWRKPKRKPAPQPVADVIPIRRRKPKPKVRPKRTVPVMLAREICTECGCLCLPAERCPSCLVWAEKDAVKASWRRAERRAG